MAQLAPHGRGGVPEEEPLQGLAALGRRGEAEGVAGVVLLLQVDEDGRALGHGEGGGFGGV